MSHIKSAAIKIMIMATATKVPATFPELEKKPPLLCAWVTMVWTAGGGVVGVIVRVLT